MKTRTRHFRTAVMLLLCAAMLPIALSAREASATTGTLSTGSGSISVSTGPGGGGGGGSATWYRRAGYTPSVEDTRSNWHRYSFSGALTSEDQFRNILFYPGQTPTLGVHGSIQDWLGGPSCGSGYSPCGPLDSNRINNNAPETPGRPGGEQYGMTPMSLTPRAWVIGRKISESTNPTDRYELIDAVRLTKAEQWPERPFSYNMANIPCATGGGGFYASIGYILNREIWTTVFDDQNWVYWRNQVNYYGINQPFSFNYQEVWVPASHCPPVIPRDKVVEVRVGQQASVNLAADLSCPAPSDNPTAAGCSLVTDRFTSDFNARQGGLSGLVSAPASGNITVSGTSPGTFQVPFTFRSRIGVEGSATLTVRVVSPVPTPSDKTITVPKGSTRSIDLWVDSECPSGYTCSLNTAAFNSNFTARSTATAAAAGVPMSSMPCVSSAAGACGGSVAADGQLYVRADRWQGSFQVPFTLTSSSGDSASATLTVRVVPAPPTPAPRTLTLQVNDVRVIDLWAPDANCPVGYTCTMDTAGFINAFAGVASTTACIDGFDDAVCGNAAVFADGRVLVRGLNPGTFQVPFTLTTNYDDSASSTLTVTVVPETTPSTPAIPVADLIVDRPPVAQVGGSLNPTDFSMRIDNVRFENCPAGFTCMVGLPGWSTGTSRGFSVVSPRSATGQGTLQFAGPYQFCDQPNRCDARAAAVSSPVSFNPTPVQALFYRATRSGVPYNLSAAGNADFPMVRWIFNDTCTAAGICTTVRYDTSMGAQNSPLRGVFVPNSTTLHVIGPRLN